MFKRILVAGLLVLAATATACGDDDDSTDESSGSDSPPVFTIKASDVAAEKQFKFELPEDLEGGAITLRLQNDGTELHDFQLIKATEGHTLEEFLADFNNEEAPFQEWLEPTGGVGATAGGQTNEVTIDVEPGKYWYFCTESSEAEGEEPVSHSTHGMSGEIEFVGDSGADFPEADASIAAKDYGFDVTGMKAGSNTFEFTNTGAQSHHALFVPLMAGATFEQAKAALQADGPPAEDAGPPPVDFEKSVATAVTDKGTRQLVTVDLPAGTYALICFLPDKGTAGPPHAAPPHNMIQELKVS